MREKTAQVLRRGGAFAASLAARLFAEGRLAAFIRGALFVGAASTVGLYLALALFVPDELVVGKARQMAALRGLSLIVEDVDYSPFGAVVLEGVTVGDEEGKEFLTIGSLTVAPRFLSFLRGTPAATATLKDIGGAGGSLKLRYESGEDFCAALEGDEAPLSVIRLLWPKMEIEGWLNGEAEFCEEQKKTTATADLRAEEVKLGGVVYGLTLDKPVNLGEVVIRAGTKEGKLEVEELSADGDFLLEATGKVTLNAQSYKNSRLEISAQIEEKRRGALQELPLLELALARFKGSDGNYAVKVTGTLQNPAVRRDTAAIRSSRVAGKERESGASRRKERDRKREERSERTSGTETSPAQEPPKEKAPVEEKTKLEEPDREPTKDAEKEAAKESSAAKDNTGSKNSPKEEPAKEPTKETEDNP